MTLEELLEGYEGDGGTESIVAHITKVSKEKKYNVIVDSALNPEHVPKHRFDQSQATNNALRNELDDNKSKLEKLSKLDTENEELQLEVTRLKDVEEKRKEADAASLRENAIITNLESLIGESELKPKVPIDKLIKFLDLSDVEVTESGKAVGLDKIFESAKTSDEWLWESDEAAGIGSPGSSKGGAGGSQPGGDKLGSFGASLAASSLGNNGKPKENFDPTDQASKFFS